MPNKPSAQREHNCYEFQAIENPELKQVQGRIVETWGCIQCRPRWEKYLGVFTEQTPIGARVPSPRRL